MCSLFSSHPRFQTWNLKHQDQDAVLELHWRRNAIRKYIAEMLGKLQALTCHRMIRSYWNGEVGYCYVMTAQYAFTTRRSTSLDMNILRNIALIHSKCIRNVFQVSLLPFAFTNYCNCQTSIYRSL